MINNPITQNVVIVNNTWLGLGKYDNNGKVDNSDLMTIIRLYTNIFLAIIYIWMDQLNTCNRIYCEDDGRNILDTLSKEYTE